MSVTEESKHNSKELQHLSQDDAIPLVAEEIKKRPEEVAIILGVNLFPRRRNNSKESQHVSQDNAIPLIAEEMKKGSEGITVTLEVNFFPQGKNKLNGTKPIEENDDNPSDKFYEEGAITTFISIRKMNNK